MLSIYVLVCQSSSSLHRCSNLPHVLLPFTLNSLLLLLCGIATMSAPPNDQPGSGSGSGPPSHSDTVEQNLAEAGQQQSQPSATDTDMDTGSAASSTVTVTQSGSARRVSTGTGY